MHTLKIKDLTVSCEDKIILKEFSLIVNSGEVHAIMGPNGIGKSTLTKVIMGDPTYKIEKGKIYYDDILINDLPTDERSRLGIFLGMQSPVSIEGVTNADFLKTAVQARDKDNFKLLPFIKNLNNTYDKLHMDKEMIHRAVNDGYSGGERKKNEIIELLTLKPNIILLDEIDSGLDVDSLKLVGENVMEYYHNSDSAILLITHYQRLLDYIKPDFVHILSDGKIIKTGNFSLVDVIEKNGYDIFNESNTNIIKGNKEHE